MLLPNYRSLPPAEKARLLEEIETLKRELRSIRDKHDALADNNFRKHESLHARIDGLEDQLRHLKDSLEKKPTPRVKNSPAAS